MRRYAVRVFCERRRSSAAAVTRSRSESSLTNRAARPFSLPLAEIPPVIPIDGTEKSGNWHIMPASIFCNVIRFSCSGSETPWLTARPAPPSSIWRSIRRVPDQSPAPFTFVRTRQRYLSVVMTPSRLDRTLFSRTPSWRRSPGLKPLMATSESFRTCRCRI